MRQEIQLLKAQIAAMSRMEYQVVTTFTPGGQLHRTERGVVDHLEHRRGALGGSLHLPASTGQTR